jgi:activator of 2-hydroxyglutaryl-CoA dehydratase
MFHWQRLRSDCESTKKSIDMHVEIITKPLELHIYGFSGIAANKDYAGTAFKLSGRMWQTVKENNIKNKGKNIWVYESDDKVFAGVELDSISTTNILLEQKNITLSKYAYYKHVGSYNLLKQVGTNMRNELKNKGFEIELPYIEIYGHWTNDESKCEAELLMCLV